jgi:hypothetical protein
MVSMTMNPSARRRSVLRLATICALVGTACAGNAQLGAKALLQGSDSLRSAAAEGALLAEDAVSGKTTSNYVHEHAVELSESASQVEATLRAGSTDPSLETERGQLVVLARRISDDLQRLSEASTVEQRTLTGELQAAADASRRIGEGLA